MKKLLAFAALFAVVALTSCKYDDDDLWNSVHGLENRVAKLEELCKQSRLLESHRYMQHGDTSVFRHSVSVAYFSYYLALKMNAPVDIHSLVRGALLHDYFLYDWHEKDASHKWHGFHHAKKACENAARDIPDLNEIEKDMIKCHMFPLNIVPPKYMEGWILCCADKICSGAETVKGRLPEHIVLPWRKQIRSEL